MKGLKSFSLIMVVLFFWTTSLSAADKYMRVQGRLTDNNGVPLQEGTPRAIFRIFTTETAGVALWTSPLQPVETNKSGLFSKDIGPIDSNKFLNQEALYLEIDVELAGRQQTLRPRQKLTSVPMAVWSEVSQEAALATTVIDGAITSPKIADQAVQFRHLSPTAVRSENIQDESIQPADFAPNAVTTDKIANRTILGDDVALETLTTVNVASNTLAGDRLMQNSITTDRIADGTIQFQDLGGNSVHNENILDGSVTGPKIAGQSIDSGHIVPSSLSPSNMNLRALADAIIPVGTIFITTGSCAPGFAEITNFQRRIFIGRDIDDKSDSIGNSAGKKGRWAFDIFDDEDETGISGVVTVRYCRKELLPH